MTDLIRWGHLQTDPAFAQKLNQRLRDPRARGSVSNILNHEAQSVADTCKTIARHELHRRPDDRRPKEMRGLPHYEDSFKVIRAHAITAETLRVTVTNTHPMARAVENGTPPHIIGGIQGGKTMIFPFKGQLAKPGGPNKFGDWLLRGPPTTGAKTVFHPGAAPHGIMRRALREYRRRGRRRFG